MRHETPSRAARPRARSTTGRQHIAACGALLVAACGTQVGEDYPGEPLLQMQGHAVVAAPTGGQAVEPALCFQREIFVPVADEWVDASTLPVDVQEAFELPIDIDGFRRTEGEIGAIETHVVAVESRGAFPDQFDVSVYVPPPAEVAIPSFEGEPRKAEGAVCAALDGRAVTARQPRISGLSGICDDAGCYGRLLVVSRDGERAYAQGFDCPPGQRSYDPSVCQETTAGDATLLFESQAEGVVGAAYDPWVIYLADPAPAGSFTAWELGASEGLEAGYYVFAAPSWDSLDDRNACAASVRPAALAEIQATYGDRIREVYGEEQDLGPFPFVVEEMLFDLQLLPADVVDGGNRILAEHEMAACPMPQLQELDARSEVSITIDVFEQPFREWPDFPGGP